MVFFVLIIISALVCIYFNKRRGYGLRFSLDMLFMFIVLRMFLVGSNILIKDELCHPYAYIMTSIVYFILKFLYSYRDSINTNYDFLLLSVLFFSLLMYVGRIISVIILVCIILISCFLAYDRVFMNKDIIKFTILSIEELAAIYICDLLAKNIISVVVIVLSLEVILVAVNEIAFSIIDKRYNCRCKYVIDSFDE